MYEAEVVRGATPRLVADVQVGDALDPIVKGPLTITEMVAWHVGVGWGEYGGGASKVAYKNRQRVPKFYVKNELGFVETRAALPLGRRVGAAHGSSRGVRLRRDAHELDGQRW